MSSRKWKFALCQHPMNLLIEHDSVCAERTPPWGARNIWDYISRMRRNVEILERYPRFRISYDISAKELKDLAQKAPSLVKKIKELLKQGRLTVINGTYSQPHLQVLGSESCLHQFQCGRKIIEDILDHKVTCYGMQEAGLNEQVPQILASLEYKSATVSLFPYAIAFLTEHELINYRERLSCLQGEESTLWQGLDGTVIPFYLLDDVDGCEDKDLTFEVQKDLFQGPIIKATFPDMIEVDEEWIEKNTKNAEFVLLDEAIKKRIEERPPKSKARIFNYWSYVEGVDGELLGKVNRKAVMAVLQAQSMGALTFLLTGKSVPDFHPIWEKILTAQHHDAYWVGGPELRKKSIYWLYEVEDECKKISLSCAENLASKIDTSFATEGKSLLVCNTYPKQRKDIVKTNLQFAKGEARGVQIKTFNGKDVPCQLLNTRRFEDGSLHTAELFFISNLPGWGYAAYALQSATSSGEKEDQVEEYVFQNEYYKASIRADGTFNSLYLKEAESELIDTSKYQGNEIKAQFPSGDWISTSGMCRKMRVSEGPVASVLTCLGDIADIRVIMHILLYKGFPRIDFNVCFQFQDTYLGNYWNDESKLNVYWPLSFQGDIYHDIAFGAVKGKENRPLFAIRWIDISDNKKGLAYFNRGTVKHWVRNSTIANILAWGTSGDEFGNRIMGETHWKKPMDLSLKGKQVYGYSIYPHLNTWKQASVPEAAQSFNQPLISFELFRRKGGDLPPQASFLKLSNPGLIPTSIGVREKKIVLRVYETNGKTIPLNMNIKEEKLKYEELLSLSGEKLEQIGPFQIAEVKLLVQQE